MGSERQSEELVKSLLADFEEDPGKIWQSNIFGKNLHELVNEAAEQAAAYALRSAPPQETIESALSTKAVQGLSALFYNIFHGAAQRRRKCPKKA